MKATTAREDFKDLLHRLQARTERALEHWLPPADTHPAQLHAAMRYGVLGGGKRIRPYLVHASGMALGAAPEDLDTAACAVELIHAYSLVHDDLPAMDDDDLRRGRPTCHRAFDVATALLAGDALQTLAFHVLSHAPSDNVDPRRRIEMIAALALAAGSRGMAGGQAIDLASVGRQLDIVELEDMHIHKTGALILASVRMGALCAPAVAPQTIKGLNHFAKCMGLAFQIRDDILDEEGETAVLGKTQGADQARNKPTYPALLGLSEAKRKLEELHALALQSIDALGADADPLRWVAHYIVDRDH